MKTLKAWVVALVVSSGAVSVRAGALSIANAYPEGIVWARVEMNGVLRGELVAAPGETVRRQLPEDQGSGVTVYVTVYGPDGLSWDREVYVAADDEVTLAIGRNGAFRTSRNNLWTAAAEPSGNGGGGWEMALFALGGLVAVGVWRALLW